MSDFVYVASVVTSYWIVSISMVYLNKILLSNEDASIPAPIFVTWYQCFITCIICIILGQVGESARKSGNKNSFFEEFPVVRYKGITGIAVLPLSLVFVGMIAFNNVCLQYVEVSFWKTTNLLTCATLIVVIAGFVLGINGEINFSLFGTSAGVISSVFVSLNSIYTSKVLPRVDNDKTLLLYYNNFNACLLFLPLIALFEYQILVDNAAKFFNTYFWLSMTLSGAMGFAIGLVTVMQVKATSPLTHNISGTAKAAFQSLLAFYIWGNEATLNGVAGILLVIFGSGLYTWVQMNAPVGDKK